MPSLCLYLYKRRGSSAEKSVRIPLNFLDISLGLLPQRFRLALDREGIDLKGSKELIREKLGKGPLIEIETGEEKLVITIEEEIEHSGTGFYRRNNSHIPK